MTTRRLPCSVLKLCLLAASTALAVACANKRGGDGIRETDSSVALGGDGGAGDGASLLAPLAIESIEPTSGSVSGGTFAIIRGDGFADGLTVKFGAAEASQIKVLSQNALQLTTPPGVLGPVDVSVTYEGVTRSLTDGFTYVAAHDCLVTEPNPAAGSEDISIAVAPTLKFSSQLDAAEAAALRVELKDIDGDSVPSDITVEGDTITVTPHRSLRFWRSYSLTVSGVTAAGESCESASVGFNTVTPSALVSPLRPAEIRDLAKVGDYLLTANGTYRGLQIYDLADPLAPLLVGRLSLDVVAQDIEVRGARAYVAGLSSGVAIVDVSNPREPTRLATVPTSGKARDVVVFEYERRQLLAVADSAEGVRLLDVTDASAVLDLGTIDPSDGAAHIDVRQVSMGDAQTLVVANGVYGVSFVDVSNPMAATVRGVFLPNENEQGEAYPPVMAAALVKGSDGQPDIVYLLDQAPFRVESWNVTDLAAPTMVARLDSCAAPCLDRPIRMAHDASGKRLFIAANRGGLVEVPYREDGTLSAKIAGRTTSSGVYATYLDTDTLYAGTEGGLAVFAASQVAPPSFFTGNDSIGNVGGLARFGSRLYAAASGRGLELYSLEDSEAPRLIAYADAPSSSNVDVSASAVVAREGGAVLANGRVGLTPFLVLDDALAPGTSIASSDRAGRLVMAADNVVYACDDNAGLLIAKADNANSMELVTRLSLSEFAQGVLQCVDVALVDGQLHVAVAAELFVFDVSTPATPRLLGSYSLNGANERIQRLAIRGGVTYVSISTLNLDQTVVASRLEAFDTSNPAAIASVWSSANLGGASGIAIWDDLVFVAGGLSGLHIFDVSEPTAPRLEGTIPTWGDAVDVVVAHDAVYLAERAGGVTVIHTGNLAD